MNTLADRIRSEAALADRPGQMDRLETIAAEVEAAEATIARIRNLADELANPDPELIVPVERAHRRTVARELRAALDPQDPA